MPYKELVIDLDELNVISFSCPQCGTEMKLDVKHEQTYYPSVCLACQDVNLEEKVFRYIFAYKKFFLEATKAGKFSFHVSVNNQAAGQI
jgi:transcription elongation factor Elf1